MNKSVTQNRLYYPSFFARTHNVFRHGTPILVLILGFPKLVLEVFIRDKMGHRHCNLLFLLLTGLGLYYAPDVLSKGSYDWQPTFMYRAFLACYAIMAVYRYWKIRPKRGIFNFKKFTISTGEPFAFFYKIRIPGITTDRRNVECYFEPVFCFLLGLVFLLTKQYPVAYTIMFCSVCYFLSNSIDAMLGDNAIWDIIDERICKEQLLELIDNDQLKENVERIFRHKPSYQELNSIVSEAITPSKQAAPIS